MFTEVNLDQTPIIGAQTDIAPLGHPSRKPAHEQTADEERSRADWDRVAALPEFQALAERKIAFIVPATACSLLYYFALPVLVGYQPALMRTRVGPMNLAYLFALSQFFMAWTMAALYVRVAAGWDREAERIVAKAQKMN